MLFDLQKASLSKRFSAYLFDLVIFLVVLTGLALILSVVTGFDSYRNDLENHYARYEAEYGIDLDKYSDFESLSDEEKIIYDKADQAFASDAEVIKTLNMILNLILVIVSISLLLSYAILEFVIPLCLKNGQTLGKKIFGIALMRDDSVKVTSVMMFVRSIIGKYTIETMVPVFLLILLFSNPASGLVSIIVILLLIVFEIVLFVKTKTRSFIHDILSYTVAVDMQSQMIFDSVEELTAYKNKIHAETVSEKE